MLFLIAFFLGENPKTESFHISSSSEFVPPAAKVLHLEVSLEVRSFLLSPICDMRVLQEGSLKMIFNISWVICLTDSYHGK